MFYLVKSALSRYAIADSLLLCANLVSQYKVYVVQSKLCTSSGTTYYSFSDGYGRQRERDWRNIAVCTLLVLGIGPESYVVLCYRYCSGSGSKVILKQVDFPFWLSETLCACISPREYDFIHS